MIRNLLTALSAIGRGLGDVVDQMRRHRASVDSNTDALESVAASNDRLASAVEKLAEAPQDEPAYVEWHVGTPERE